MENLSPFLINAAVFFLGVIGTILVSIIANLLTPDKETLIRRFQNWRAKRSSHLAKKRIIELQNDLRMAKKISGSQSELIQFLFMNLFRVLMYFIQGTLFLAMSLFIKIPLVPGLIDLGIIFLPVFFWNCGRALFRTDYVILQLSNLSNLSEFEAKTLIEIEFLENKFNQKSQ